MKQQAVRSDKKILIALLYAVAIAIILMGASFGVYSAIHHVQLPVLSSSVPGVVFGLVILFLGIRYLFSLRKLRAEVYRTTSVFSWSNFQNTKNNKA